MDHLAESESYDNQKGCQENINGRFRWLGDHLVESCRRTAVDEGPLFGIGKPRLEGGVLVEVLAPAVGCRGGEHEADDAGGKGYHQHLGDGNHVSVGIGDGYESDDCRCDGRAGNADLRGDGSHSAGPFRTYALLKGDVADNRHDGIDHMAGTYENGKEEGGKGGQEGYVLGMLPQHLLRNLDHPVHAT